MSSGKDSSAVQELDLDKISLEGSSAKRFFATKPITQLQFNDKDLDSFISGNVR